MWRVSQLLGINNLYSGKSCFLKVSWWVILHSRKFSAAFEEGFVVYRVFYIKNVLIPLRFFLFCLLFSKLKKYLVWRSSSSCHLACFAPFGLFSLDFGKFLFNLPKTGCVNRSFIINSEIPALRQSCAKYVPLWDRLNVEQICFSWCLLMAYLRRWSGKSNLRSHHAHQNVLTCSSILIILQSRDIEFPKSFSLRKRREDEMWF